MVRLAAYVGLAICLLSGAAMAGQASARFKVGITIGAVGNPSTGAIGSERVYTWGAAAVSVKQAGFDNLQRVAKSDTLYWFEAERAGSTFRVAVSISSGEIVKVIPA